MAATELGIAVPSADADVLERLLRGRWSCRGYLSERLPRAVIERVLQLAQRTPSWCNTQPWHVVITEGDGTDRFRQALTKRAAEASMEPDFAFPQRYTGAYRERRKEVALQLYESVGIARGDREASAAQTAKNFEFFGAPHVAVITTDADLGVYGAVDCGLYVQSFLLAAHSLGLGAVPQAALASYAPVVREFFALPESRRVVCGISFGRPDADHPANGFRAPRESAASAVTWVD
ncbi:nitroreductase [Streptomyces arenae]|uniref:nitroreductase n=1 Tax=Streptomyces arenae TaxID=29301 RepID=UPI00265AE8DC|nr:nitroreductase [Streptomyces arenae]MCG7207398.1 nitroreductase [Streptomyces arenae]